MVYDSLQRMAFSILTKKYVFKFLSLLFNNDDLAWGTNRRD